MKELASQLILASIDQEASDIYILPQSDKYTLSLRSHGEIFHYSKLDLSQGRKLISFFKFLADMDVGEKRKPQSGACQYDLAQGQVELRMSTITNVNLMESMVIRVLKHQLGEAGQVETFFPQDLQIINQLMFRKSGLILFSGPVGSGKTTTIYQCLKARVAQTQLQVITMEDPVEIYEERFLQTEVNDLAGISYDELIKASLRHTPDILVIGEIRDEETARMVIRAALTGHLVIATLHAKNCLGIIARLQELQVSREQLAQTLIGVSSQRLISKLCPVCQGPCRKSCRYFDGKLKRAALFEVLTGSRLQQVLQVGTCDLTHHSLNAKLRKAWSYGYISQEHYLEFELL